MITSCCFNKRIQEKYKKTTKLIDIATNLATIGNKWGEQKATNPKKRRLTRMELMKREEVAKHLRQSVAWLEVRSREKGHPLSRYLQDGARGTRFWKKSDVDAYLESIYGGTV